MGNKTAGSTARQNGGLTPERLVEQVKNYIGDPTFLFKEYSMKNVLLAFGIIALAAVIRYSMTACGGIYEKID
ncbi:MAG: hypothetical protein LBB81_07750 [Treponema sp.]|jgi:hypothetical protein|nr:hypothetical protein [Treponema sp.]